MKSHKALSVVSLVVLFVSAFFFLPEPMCTGGCIGGGKNVVASTFDLPEPVCSGKCIGAPGNVVAFIPYLPEPACTGHCIGAPSDAAIARVAGGVLEPPDPCLPHVLAGFGSYVSGSYAI